MISVRKYHLNVTECLVTEIGQEYAGTQSTTESGATCVSWVQGLPFGSWMNDPNAFPDPTVGDASNYCRNPDRQTQGPWCYTSTSGDRENCAITKCEGRNGYAHWKPCLNYPYITTYFGINSI